MSNKILTLPITLSRKILHKIMHFFGINGIFLNTSQSNSLLPLSYTYRASSEGIVIYKMKVSGIKLIYKLYTTDYTSFQPVNDKLCFSFEVNSLKQGDVLQVDLLNQEAWINTNKITPSFSDDHSSRKLIAEIYLTNHHQSLDRKCLHYLPFDTKQIGQDYYFGDDYIDYPQQTNTKLAIDLVTKYCSHGHLLDIGCALGIYTKSFSEAGFDAYGIDTSEFAVNEARKRVGEDRIKQCNIESCSIPFNLSFDVFWMWDVLEHSKNPKEMLKKVSNKALSGSWLFLHTSNSDSLTHKILGVDWEGFTDYSHYGVDVVSSESLSRWLTELGWEIIDWKCELIWFGGIDPGIERLREVFQKIPELTTLLSERELGDLITLVAKKD